MFEASLTAAIAQWGLPALGVGAFVEGDAVAFMGGVLAHRGLFGFWPVVAVVALGAFVWDQTLFQLGRRAIDARWLAGVNTSALMGQVRAQVAAHPLRWAVGFRFVWGLRAVCPVALGASGLALRVFVLADMGAVIVWALLVCGIGYGAGHVIVALFGTAALHNHMLIAAALFAALAGGVWVWRRRA